MRGQDPPGRMIRRRAIALLISVVLCAAGSIAIAQTAAELIGPKSPMETVPAEPVPKWITDDIRRMRAYPEQPPVIPHSIEGYQLSVNANRCLSCHKREFTVGSGAPMISVTHYMDRSGQMLADVSPRRYFCTACHVPQADAQPLVENTFRDMSEMGVAHAGDQ